MSIANLNGNLCTWEEIRLADLDRAFRFGDSIFETIRVFEGQCSLLPLHYRRLSRGLEVFEMPKSDKFTEAFFLEEIRKLLDKKENARIRITFFRAKGKRYTPQRQELQFLIEKEPIQHSVYTWNSEGLSMGVNRHHVLHKSPVSAFKTGNSLPYVLSGIYAKKQGWDVSLLLDPEGRPSDTTYANIWIINGKEIFTPTLQSGCIDGVIRSFLLEHFVKAGWKICTAKLTLEDLLDADSIFLTNAIIGLQWVKHFADKQYASDKPLEIFEWLNKMVPSR